VVLTLPLILGLTMTFSTELFFKLFGSYLPRGSIAGLNYGLRVMLVLVAFFGQALGTASFPFMARLAAENRMDEMNRLLNATLKHLSLVVPFSILLMVLRHEVIVILFQRGRFDADATALTARILFFMMVGAFAFAAQTVVVRGFYAVQNTLLPAMICTVAVLLSLPLYWAGMKMWGAGGIALAISLSAVLQVLLLYAIWNKRGRNTQSGEVYTTFARMAMVSLPVGALVHGIRNVLAARLDVATFTGSLAVAAVTGGVFLAVLAASGYLLNIEEITSGLKLIGRRVGRRPSSTG
jgi:putative peptidoglycan lipid II flippase